MACLGSLVFSVWDLQRLEQPAMGSRPQPTCLLRLDLNERCDSLIGCDQPTDRREACIVCMCMCLCSLQLGPSPAALVGAVASAAGSDTLCCSLSGARLPCVLVSFRPEAAAAKEKKEKKKRPPAMRGVSCLAASAPDVTLTWLRYGSLGIPRQLSPAVCLSGWPGRLCLLNYDDNGGPHHLLYLSSP